MEFSCKKGTHANFVLLFFRKKLLQNCPKRQKVFQFSKKNIFADRKFSQSEFNGGL